ncbi:hypothetical protein GOBAR_AA13686 [Gossypium barbadense]|uniref:Uncharacterized protein n=1 Tax=Gossypium barbadense TaxID=3634 RepID=A0A2P5XUI8_GOSBA|nr:hypothetical protein GOBAR_AA13686 [Gossypium barbadense]
MAAKPGSAPVTYSPNLGQKTRPPIFKDNDLDWVRPDGRGFHQCRPAFFRTGAVNSASGSAYAELGSTKVIVSVFGPRESKKAMMYSDTGRLNCNVSYTTFATPVRGQGSDHKEFSSMLHKALEGAIMLETFPKTTVDVFALVLESGGSFITLVTGDLPVVISCASLALADAGIMMYDLVAAVSVSCLGKNLVIDPVLEEESYQDGSLMLTCMPSRNEVTQLTFTGEWSTPDINEVDVLFRPNFFTERALAAAHTSPSADGILGPSFRLALTQHILHKLGKVMRTCLKEAASASQE